MASFLGIGRGFDNFSESGEVEDASKKPLLRTISKSGGSRFENPNTARGSIGTWRMRMQDPQKKASRQQG